MAFINSPKTWKPTNFQSHYETQGTGSTQTKSFCLKKRKLLLEYFCCCSSICKMPIYIQQTGGSWHKSLTAISSFIRLCPKSHYRGLCYGPLGTHCSTTLKKLISLLVLCSNFSPRSQVSHHGAL